MSTQTLSETLIPRMHLLRSRFIHMCVFSTIPSEKWRLRYTYLHLNWAIRIGGCQHTWLWCSFRHYWLNKKYIYTFIISFFFFILIKPPNNIFLLMTLLSAPLRSTWYAKKISIILTTTLMWWYFYCRYSVLKTNSFPKYIRFIVKCSQLYDRSVLICYQ